MKKLLSTILVLVFILAALSTLAPLISAKSATISEKEAEELVKTAMDFFYDARVEGYNENIMDHISEDRRKVHLPEYNRDVTYLPIDESKLPGGSYSAMCELAKNIYSEDIASDSYNLRIYKDSAGATVKYPNFYVDESGKVFVNHFLVYGYVSVRSDTVNLISNIRGDSSAASAIIAIHSYWADGPRPYYYYPVECKFVNTADGWRIAESEYSILLASEKNYLDAYREENPDKVSADALKLIDAEAKYTVDEIMIAISCIYNYKQDYYEYAQKNGKEVNSISKEIITDNGEKKTMQYFELVSLGRVIDYGESEYTLEFCVTESTCKFFDRAYADGDFERKIKEGGEDYVAVPDKVNFIYDPETAVVKVVESTDKEATARVYCELIKDGKRIPIYVECKLEKPYGRWDVAESPFIDMITSADEFEYTVGEAPATGDNSFDTITICLGGMAIVMSVLCLVRRKREF